MNKMNVTPYAEVMVEDSHMGRDKKNQKLRVVRYKGRGKRYGN